MPQHLPHPPLPFRPRFEELLVGAFLAGAHATLVERLVAASRQIGDRFGVWV
jgi:hypothetical protein